MRLCVPLFYNPDPVNNPTFMNKRFLDDAVELKMPVSNCKILPININIIPN